MLSGDSGTLVPYQLLSFLLFGNISSGGLVAKSCLTLMTPWTARLLCPRDFPGKWVSISFSRRSSGPRN